MKKLLCLLALLGGLMALLVVDLVRGEPESVELATHVDREKTDRPTTPRRPPRQSRASELQRVIRQGAE
jgi:hypothetical protein